MSIKKNFTTHTAVTNDINDESQLNKIMRNLNKPYNKTSQTTIDKPKKEADEQLKESLKNTSIGIVSPIPAGENYEISDDEFKFDFSDVETLNVNQIINNAINTANKGYYDHNGSRMPIGSWSNGHCTYGPSTFYSSLGNLQGYFWNTRDPQTATDTNLTQKGFEKIWKGNYEDLQDEQAFKDLVLMPGDLVITYGIKDTKNGEVPSTHISMWTGKLFISDFILKGALVYNKERKGDSGYSVEVLRLNPSKVKVAKQGMKIENDSTEKIPTVDDDSAYEFFLSTAPDNIRHTTPDDYRMRLYWELHDKPKTFWDGLDKNMFHYNEKEKKFHANSVAEDKKTGIIEFMKSPKHQSVHMETDWYNLGKVYPENGDPYLLTPEHGEAYEEWLNFKNNYDLDESGEFFKYIPKKKDVPKDAEGAKIIVIEKEVIKEPEIEKDPLKCLLCLIMNAMGHRHHAFSELRPDKLTDIFGGNAEIVIEMGGPEKAYDEDSFEEMLKDILPLVSTSKKYSKDDIKEIRSKKAEYGTSMKRLLSLMDDDKILKAFHGMLLFKTGGEIQFEAEGGLIDNKSTIDVEIGEITYHLYEAKTAEEKKKGLIDVKNLNEDEGMIFYWDEPLTVSMTMKECEIPLLICFFDEDLECISVKQVEALSEEPIIEDNVQFVVELHHKASVKKGDELDFPGDDDEYVMLVLGSDGSILMLLKGGERIFSRPNTKILLKWAKQAYNSNNPSDFRRLGKLLFKYLDQQDNREPEYVSLDSKNA